MRKAIMTIPLLWVILFACIGLCTCASITGDPVAPTEFLDPYGTTNDARFAAADGSDVIINGSFFNDTGGWTFAKEGKKGNPSGSWDSSGYANGGAAKISSEIGRRKRGIGYWEQTIAFEIQAGSSVSLSYSYKTSYNVTAPFKQDIYISIVKPNGTIVNIDEHLGVSPSNNVWFTITEKDVSAYFDQTGIYKIRLRYKYKTGAKPQAQAFAWFDEVELLVSSSTSPPPNQQPVAAAHASSYNVETGETVYFYDDSTDPDGLSDIEQWEWDFSYNPAQGFQPESLAQNPSHQYSASGVYQVQLRVTDSVGQTDMLNEDEILEITVSETPPPPADQWNEKAPTPYAGGYGESVASTDSHIYVIRNLYASSLPQFWSYNPITDSWVSLSIEGLPAGAFRNGTTLTWDNADNLFGLGGARYSDNDRRLFFRYSISEDIWTQVADAPAPQGAGDATDWSGYDNRLYAILGSSSHGTAFARYDASTNTWDVLASPPAGVDDGASIAWTGGISLYALRGEYYESIPLQDFWSYDIVDNSWTTLTPIPEEDGVGDGASLIWIGDWNTSQTDYVYALGGGAVDEKPGYNFYRYSISNNAWETLPAISYPIGYYNGNRLGFTSGYIYYWQGSPTSFSGGGKKFARFEW